MPLTDKYTMQPDNLFVISLFRVVVIHAGTHVKERIVASNSLRLSMRYMVECTQLMSCTILLSHDPLSLSAYPMITYIHTAHRQFNLWLLHVSNGQELLLFFYNTPCR